jgi:hypothetical protein
MVRSPPKHIVNMTARMATGRSGLMSMIVSYPWPVAWAHAQLVGHNPDAHEDKSKHQTPCPEELVRWTGRERLRFTWYRLRLAVQDTPWWMLGLPVWVP